jgi:ankyrin repeat protein
MSYAAENGHKAVVKLLLEAQAETDSKDGDGRTPLSYASQNGHEAVEIRAAQLAPNAAVGIHVILMVQGIMQIRVS